MPKTSRELDPDDDDDLIEDDDEYGDLEELVDKDGLEPWGDETEGPGDDDDD